MAKQHKSPPFRSKDFRELQDRWYRKLKKSGFEDIECIKDRDGLLRNIPDSPKWNSRQKGRREELVGFFYHNDGESLTTQYLFQYFRLARIFLSHGTFTSKFHEKCFEYFTNGESYRQMQPKLKKNFRKVGTSIYCISKAMVQNRKDMLQFHLTHPEGEYLHATEVPNILDPSISVHSKS